jgi:hypothetical protein
MPIHNEQGTCRNLEWQPLKPVRLNPKLSEMLQGTELVTSASGTFYDLQSVARLLTYMPLVQPTAM